MECLFQCILRLPNIIRKLPLRNKILRLTEANKQRKIKCLLKPHGLLPIFFFSGYTSGGNLSFSFSSFLLDSTSGTISPLLFYASNASFIPGISSTLILYVNFLFFSENIHTPFFSTCPFKIKHSPKFLSWLIG